MNTPNIRVKIKNFRAVNNADIIVDGITLVAGENGCGKSSISKLLYFLYKTAANYDSLIKNKLSNNLRDVLKFLDIVQQEAGVNIKDRSTRNEYRRELNELRRNLYGDEFLEEQLVRWLSFMDKLEENYNSIIRNSSQDVLYHNNSRLNYIISDILKKNITAENINPFHAIKDFIDSKFKEAINKIELRPTSVFVEELEGVFSDGDLPSTFEVYEFDDLIVSLENDTLAIPYSIQNAIYIDTPMMLSVDDSHNLHWNDLNELLLEKGNSNNIFSQIISKEITQGDVVYDDTIFLTEDYKFKRNDGATFNLIDVATGIKSFSILQILLKNQLLTNKTLLIIDEPESNLHPQWIIEYARIIVMLNKELGVKFFLATHNPDMVSAIRYISEKEGTLEKVNFYLAKRSEELFKYNYLFLDKEIDPIFESFNIAIDKINRYGI